MSCRVGCSVHSVDGHQGRFTCSRYLSCHGFCKKALHFRVQGSETCTRDYKMQQGALPLVPTVISCAMQKPLLSGLRVYQMHAYAPAGWQFLFKRCSRSTALQIALTPRNAEHILTAFSGMGAFPELDQIEDMRVTIPEADDATESATVLLAFSALALACKDTQVCSMLVVSHSSIAGSYVDSLPYARSRASSLHSLL